MPQPVEGPVGKVNMFLPFKFSPSFMQRIFLLFFTRISFFWQLAVWGTALQSADPLQLFTLPLVKLLKEKTNKKQAEWRKQKELEGWNNYRILLKTNQFA